MIKLRDILTEAKLSKEEIQSIVDRVYPEITSHYGPGPRGIPEVTIHSNIYARESGIEGIAITCLLSAIGLIIYLFTV